MKNVILVTGANGFIGRRTVTKLSEKGYTVHAGIRCSSEASMVTADKEVIIGDIGKITYWGSVLQEVDVVVHLAARAHVLKESLNDPLSSFRCINTQGTLDCARMAAKTGVKRFIYVSSIGVNGNLTTNKPFTELDTPKPHDFYAISKYEAEQALWNLARETGLEIVIIRPPLVYGPGAPGNMERLLRFVKSGVPLPFGMVKNKRSMIALDNMVEFLSLCIEHPAAVGETFLISDGEDLSTPELIRQISYNMDCASRLFPFPPGLLKISAMILRKSYYYDRLCGSLQLDIRKAKELLGWEPICSVEKGLRNTVNAFIKAGV